MNLDRWFLKQVEVSIRKGPRGDKTAGCVDETFLKSYAEEATKISLADDRVEHVASCSYCMGCLLELRASQRAKGSSGVRNIAVARLWLAAVVIGGIVAFCLHHWHPEAANVHLGELRRTVDLSQQLATQTPLHLPSALLRLEILLPQTGKAGVYDIAIAACGNGGERVAHAEGNSSGAGPRIAVIVSLDLKHTAPGKYELSTQLRGESTPHLYPLEIDPL